MHTARALKRSANHDNWCGRRYRNHQPEERGKRASGQRNEFQPERVSGIEVPDDAEGQQEHDAGHRSQRNQRNVDDPMEFAALAAVLAGLKVALVVATHFRRDAGNVVSPAGQNAANEFVTALR